MRALLAMAVLALALAGCIEPRYFRATGATVYPPTEWWKIAIVPEIPAGAETLGDVEGIGRGWGLVFRDDEETDARKGAAQLGATAIYIESRGTQLVPGDIWARNAPSVRAKALRLAK
jgi:hypothetical protein